MESSFVEVYNENLNGLLSKLGDLNCRRHKVCHGMQHSEMIHHEHQDYAP